MKIISRNSVFVKNQYFEELKALLGSRGIELKVNFTDDTDQLTLSNFEYSISKPIEYNDIIPLYSKIQRFDKDIGESFYFHFEDEEYENAPFLEILGVGNASGGYLTGSEKSFTSEIICDRCKRKKLTQTASLLVDTSRLKKRLAVFVNNHLVISEKFAQLLNDWGMKGYELREVTHKGNPIKQHPAYQIVATAYMPMCSEEWKQLYFYTEDKRCFDCHLTGLSIHLIRMNGRI